MSTDSLSPDPALAERLERAKPELAAASLRYMSVDPFWQERYADRASTFAAEDASYHVTYLITAVWEGSLTPLREYARWLRSVLVSRGMCTRHLSAHFEELQKVLDANPGVAPASSYLRHAIDALIYESDAAAALQLEARALAAQVQVNVALPFHSAWDPEHLVHYVADALAAGHDRWLAGHLRWARTALEARQAGVGLDDILERLHAALAGAAAHGRAAAGLLEHAREQAQVEAQ